MPGSAGSWKSCEPLASLSRADEVALGLARLDGPFEGCTRRSGFEELRHLHQQELSVETVFLLRELDNDRRQLYGLLAKAPGGEDPSFRRPPVHLGRVVVLSAGLA